MVLSPSKNSRSELKLDCFQENLGSELFHHGKCNHPKEGSVILGDSDFPNRQTSLKRRSLSCEFGVYNNSQLPPPEPHRKQLMGGVFLDSNDKIDMFELQGVPGVIPSSDTPPSTTTKPHNGLMAEGGETPMEVCLFPAVQVREVDETCTLERLTNSYRSPGDTTRPRSDVRGGGTDHVEDVTLEFPEAASGPVIQGSFRIFLSESFQDVKRSPAVFSSDNSDELYKTSSPGKDSSGDWSDGGLNRRKERVVPEETLKNSRDFEDDEDTDLAPLPFSGPISAVAYSGPIYSNVGSISKRSDSSNTSTRSFAFPILPGFEWNASPARMPPPDRRWKKRRSWRFWLCCSKPKTFP